MPLFDVPARRNNRENDKKTLSKLKIRQTSASKVKGGLSGRIQEIVRTVDVNLGSYRDKYEIITDEQILKEYIDKCIENKYTSIDTETTGLDPLQDEIAGICIYTHNMKGAYIPINHVNYVLGTRLSNQLPCNIILTYLERLLEHKIAIDMFNAKFDIRVLRHFGLKNIYCTWDGYLAGRLLNENEEQKGLKYLHNKYVLKGEGSAFKYDDLFKGIPFTQIPLDTAYLYAANDPVITYELCEFQRKYLREDNEREDLRNLYHVFRDVEMPCISVIADMEDNGIEFDMNYQFELSQKYHKLLEEKKANFYKECEQYKDRIDGYRISNPKAKLDNPINISSPSQIAILLYDILKIEPVDRKTPRGTGEDILKKIDIPVTRCLLEYREVYKLINTYIDKLPECVNQNDGRIHCSFNQYGADTGRMSSSDPNMQNIPSHNKDIRQLFKASDGYVLMSSDYSQQEPKVMTQMCGDKKMLDSYMQGKDLYAQIASLSFNKPYEECLEFRQDGSTNKEGKARRTQAKSILLGTLYGRGVTSIAEQLKVTPEKAQTIKDSVFKGFPAIPKFEQESLQMAKELGYVTTLWGRKRRLPDLQLDEFDITYLNGKAPEDLLDFGSVSKNATVPLNIQKRYATRMRNAYSQTDRSRIVQEALDNGIVIKDNRMKIADATRQCVNARIQGSAADMSKLAMIKVGNDKRLKELGFRLLIPVHDELIAECPLENAKECEERFATLMSEAAESKLTIPIKCDVEITKCWYGEEINID